MFITYLLVFKSIATISGELTATQTLSSEIQDLSSNKHNSQLKSKIIETHPFDEGFILLSANHDKPLASEQKSNISLRHPPSSTVYNTSSTTCITVTKTKSITNISSPIINHSIGHLGRRLLNEPSYDTDLDISSPQALLQDDNEIGDFLQVNEEDMHKAFVTFEVTADGSGETTDYTTEYSTEVASTSIEITATQTTSSATISLITTTITQADTTEAITDIPEITTIKTPDTAAPTTLLTEAATTDASTTILTDVLSTSIDTTISEVPTTSVSETTVVTGITTDATSIITTSITTIDKSTVSFTFQTSSQLTTTTTTITIPDDIILPNKTTFYIKFNCTNANDTLMDILADLKNPLYEIMYTYDKPLPCSESEKVTATLIVQTPDSNVTTLNNLYETLENLTRHRGLELLIVNRCGRGDSIDVVKNTTSCYLIDQCGLCGIDPVRGICDPKNRTVKCRCFTNDQDLSAPYEGDFCSIPSPKPIKSTFSPSRWTPIIVGVLAGLAALFCAITCCLWLVAAWRRRHHNAQDELLIRRIWHLPRAEVPTTVTAENVPTYLGTTNSTISTQGTDSVHTRGSTTNSTFFKELDQKMGEKLRATITRPNTSGMLASLPSDTASTLSSYDPIDELDAIIDNEDMNATFHDPLDELYEDNEMLEVMNPNLKLPRPNVDSKPTGLFSFF
ncbi:hypothetical protein I4U23_002604 [Adineta vaga]|nr:hypothetical protein I4U23_002604 [Adineta vaga]